MPLSRSLLVLGLVLLAACLTKTSPPASDLTLVQQGGHTPLSWLSLNWTFQGRAGNPGGDWELGIGRNNFPAPTQTAQWKWQNGQDVPWSMTWNGKTVVMKIGDRTLSFEQSQPPSSRMTGFYLLVLAETQDQQIVPGTALLFQVDRINGQAMTPVMSQGSVTGKQRLLAKQFFTYSTPISSLSGILRMSWPANTDSPQVKEARSRLQFKLEGFDTHALETIFLLLNRFIPRNAAAWVRGNRRASSDSQ